MRARGRQAQRSRQRRLHRAPPHLLRDAGQLLVRRLLQGARHRARLAAGHEGLRPAGRAPDSHGLRRGRRGPRALAQDRRAARRARHTHPHLGQFLGHGRDRPLRPLLGDLLRSRPARGGRPARQRRSGRRPLRRDLEPGVHAVRAGHARRADRPAQALHRHRHGSGADRRDPAGHPRQLRDRPVQAPDRRERGAERHACRRCPSRLPSGGGRSPARERLPDRRRRDAVERGAGLRAQAHHAARHAPRPPDGLHRAADVAPGADPGARDGPGLRRACACRAAHRRDAEAGGDPLQGNPRQGPAPA